MAESNLQAARVRDPKAGVDGEVVSAAADTFGYMVRQVDFPAFVSSLIKGVFSSIVDSSIRQMEAYQALLSSVAQSVGAFADANISDAEGRDHLLSLFPTQLAIEDGRIVIRGNEELDFRSRFGPSAPEDITGEEEERALVRQAKMELAKQKQQMLGTMVLLGINRIIVTNGEINAKVVFDVQASESASSSSASGGQGAAQGASALGTGMSNTQAVQTTVSTFNQGDLQEGSESISAKASLSGEVRLKFKSETFPLEKMADPVLLATLQGKSVPTPPGPPEGEEEEAYGGRGAPRPRPRGPRGTRRLATPLVRPPANCPPWLRGARPTRDRS